MSRKSLVNLSIFLTVFLIAGTIGTYIRLFPLRHYTSDTSWDQASLLVINNAVTAIRNKINASSITPLSQEKQIQLAKTKLNEVMSTEKQEVKDAIYRVAKKIDQETPPRYPFPYLLASDSYYYYALTQKIAETGRISPEIKGSKYFYPEMSAPTGYWEPLTLHPYVGFGVYKIAHLFNPKIPLMFAVSFTPLVMTLLILLVFLALAQNQRCSGWAMLVAGVYLLCARIFLKRSAFAWYDNDSYSIFFPMLLMLIVSFAFSAENRGKKIYCGILAAITLALYTMFWQGWMFVATILAASGTLFFILERLMKKPSAERSGRFWMAFGLGALGGISVIFGMKEIFVLFHEGWQALLGFMNAKLSVWPETYIAVGELKKLSLSANIGLTGGWFALAISFFGLVSRTRQMFVEKNIVRHRLFIVTVIFAAAASVISIGAQRFTLLCVTPFSILFLFGIHDLLELITGLTAKIPQLRQPLIQKVGVPAALCLVLIVPKAVHSETTMIQLLDPLFNSTWENSLTWIRENTPPDSIIDTWWPPGHFIKAMAGRRVLFDGATINNPKGYWLASALLATTEQEALAFLRLANNDCIQAVAILREAGMTDSQTVSILKSLIRLPEQDALALASQKLDGDKAKTLIAVTHNDPGPVYLLVYNEMMENFLLYPFVARWNFEKVEQINADPQLRARISRAGSTEYIDFLWGISGGNPKISNILSTVGQQGSQLVFAENLVVDLADKTCRIKSGKYGTGIPMLLFYEENGQVRSLPLSGGNLPYAVVVGKRHGQYQARLLEIALAQSFLTRLYFFGDTGLNHIKRVRQDKNLTGKMQIDVFKIEP